MSFLQSMFKIASEFVTVYLFVLECWINSLQLCVWCDWCYIPQFMCSLWKCCSKLWVAKWYPQLTTGEISTFPTREPPSRHLWSSRDSAGGCRCTTSPLTSTPCTRVMIVGCCCYCCCCYCCCCYCCWFGKSSHKRTPTLLHIVQFDHDGNHAIIIVVGYDDSVEKTRRVIP